MTQMFQSTDPASGQLVWEGMAATSEQVGRAVARARETLPRWAAMPLDRRIGHLQSFKSVLEGRSRSMAETISRETGKPQWEARAELASMIAKVDVSIAAQAERAGNRRAPMPFGEAVLRHRPQGVMAVMGPFNFPGHLPNGHIVPALLAGNTVVFKPSELAPATGEAMAAASDAAGLPPGVFNLVQGGRDTGAALAEQDIDGLLFTGSAQAGAFFRRHFADRPKVILALELGGNNPLVVWDGDVEEAAALVVQSAFVTTGQRCSCARRLIVPDTPFGAQVIEAVAELSDRLIIGAWDENPEPYMGPLISPAAAERARAQLRQLAAIGGRCIRPLAALYDRRDNFVAPAIVDVTGTVPPDEEIFAPALQITRVASFDEALAAANATRFGLCAGLVTRDDALWRRFVLEVRAGVVNRNRPTTGASGQMPFGGLGDSGNHRPSGYYAADYCAHPVASFEAAQAQGHVAAIRAMTRP